MEYYRKIDNLRGDRVKSYILILGPVSEKHDESVHEEILFHWAGVYKPWSP